MAVTNKFRSGGERFGYQRGNVLKRDKCRCIDCGSTQNLEVHHLIPYEIGNKWTVQPENLVVLCHKCHVALHLDSIRDNTGYLPKSMDSLTKIGFFDFLSKYVSMMSQIKNGEVNINGSRIR